MLKTHAVENTKTVIDSVLTEIIISIRFLSLLYDFK